MKDSRQYSRSPMEKKHKCGCFSHIPDLGKNKDSELGEITWFFCCHKANSGETELSL